MRKPPHIAVIGAGYAGVAAALTLADAGAQISLFEAGPLPGGRARRIHWHDQALDNGQHIALGAYTELLRLMRKVHRGPLPFRRMPLRWEMWQQMLLQAPAWGAPLTTLWALLRAQGWGWADKQALLRFLAGLRLRGFRSEDRPASEWLASQTPRVIQTFWEPLCYAALNTPLQEASAQVFYNVVRDSLLAGGDAAQMLLPTVDLSALLPEPALAWLTAQQHAVHLGQKVTQLTLQDDQVALQVKGEWQSVDGVICATGPHQLPALLHTEQAPAALQAVSQFGWQPIRTVYLQYPAGTRLPQAMIGLHHCLPGGVVHWVFDRGVLLGEDGRMAAVISAAMTQPMSGEQIASQAASELAQAFPGLPAPLWCKTLHEARATFACTPGLHRPDGHTASPRVRLAGDYLAGDYPATLEGAVRSGVAAAQALLAQWTQP
ncbi:hydroxysqualene dehydroxylase HpnE [Leeia aquatica]|uniref:FAD-dependent oxidoreductase n=1 Tax=Leeia aquatica TaxID=2725557 RepID=A0A847S4G7_9NEIS|nr:hydroxysqualene dehydroxylase HpnE [Leeia aquatica]NLR74037.1 FAD-dependent oxidoreductase [Leeia aquatica]